ncbi:putative protein [Arabidopsis thaliana]|uniref:Uncharacterized protein T20K14_30 n=1 Tax=Arabidopsis thaliana TaxID=3702 RepID=Q9LF40_ARATH|nr:uncharacterized protein AT5G15420 [Arabidopsis thaliana]AED92159.1 hypothetical protein AT5G15420 [Arabidopsis thaliana]CAC01741.1 putative protein [Arabidopsis thaliana]|eukprot:NP_197046.1 hypothetical protein AT5G15420 [Arabidopsis thaliana]
MSCSNLQAKPESLGKKGTFFGTWREDSTSQLAQIIQFAQKSQLIDRRQLVERSRLVKIIQLAQKSQLIDTSRLVERSPLIEDHPARPEEPAHQNHQLETASPRSALNYALSSQQAFQPVDCPASSSARGLEIDSSPSPETHPYLFNSCINSPLLHAILE